MSMSSYPPTVSLVVLTPINNLCQDQSFYSSSQNAVFPILSFFLHLLAGAFPLLREGSN